ncbi:hypothetical protein HDU98_010534 [Podochytrium sp. JEL0797]|nr:hypothetical protein HDU98_010534 [Podochytrium sp. JEL0797]
MRSRSTSTAASDLGADSDSVEFDESIPNPKTDPNVQRIRMPKKQMEWLKQRYAENPHPTPERMKEMADRVGMEKRKLRIWFQNRRAVEKRRGGSSIV